MTGDEFFKKMYKAVSGEKSLDSVDVLRVFAEEFRDKVLDAVNGCCTNDTAYVIACILEEIAKSVRSTTKDGRAMCMEMLYRTAFKTEAMHISVPGKIDLD